MRSSNIPSTSPSCPPHPTPPTPTRPPPFPPLMWSLAGAGVRGRTISLQKSRGTTPNPNKIAVQSGSGDFPVWYPWVMDEVCGGREGGRRRRGVGWVCERLPCHSWAAVEDFGSRCTSIKSQWDSETSFCSRELPSPLFLVNFLF